MSILGKPAKRLTAEDYKALEKRVGSDVPYPMSAPGFINTNNGSAIVRYLGVLDVPMLVHSERSHDEVTGMLMREMATPEMLPMMFKVFSAMNPHNERRALFVKGAPGAGKTYLGELAGRVASPHGAIVVDCTGLNLTELFFETVLDFKASQKFYDLLDEKLKHYNEAAGNPDLQDSILNPRSIEILRDSLGEAFKENEQGRVSIDWRLAHKSHKDENGNYLTSRECTEIVKHGLAEVSEKEGLNNSGGNSLGMATQRGPAWRAYEEGRVLILDEFNRAKKGTFGVVHGWLQFMINEKQVCTVNNPLKEKGDRANENLVFHRSQMGAGHFVYMTGNKEEDSDEVMELPEALSSRIVSLEVPKLTQEGWQHRFCQMLTGLPVSTIYESQRDVWEQNPAAFGEFLVRMRKQGETREIPAYQLHLLARKWRDVLEASANFAKFMDGASKAVNPDSDLYTKSTSLAQLLDEVGDIFKKEVAVDLRKITYFLNEAFLDKPVVRTPVGIKGPGVMPLLSAEDVPESPEDLHMKLGSHMTYAMLDWIVSISFDRGKPKLGGQLMRLAQDCGIVSASLQEGLATNKKTFAQLLDSNPYESEDPDVKAEVARDLLCAYMRRLDKNLNADNDKIITVGAVRAVLESMYGADLFDGADEDLPEAVVFNDDPEVAPVQGVDVVDAIKTDGRAVPTVDLATRTAMLFALAAPATRELNMETIWSRALSKSGLLVKDEKGNVVKDPALRIAEGDTESDFAVTTLMVANEDKAQASPLHLVWNRQAKKLLVVGEGALAPELRRAFNGASASYVDRLDAEAASKVEKALLRVAGAEARKQEKSLKNAFLMRVMLASEKDEEKAGFADLLVRRDSVAYLPLFVTKKPSSLPGPAPKAA